MEGEGWAMRRFRPGCHDNDWCPLATGYGLR
jgi:hypothetical protein